MGSDLVCWAAEEAGKQLRGLPRRWRHVQGVARQARLAAGVVDDADMLIAAAWLHDIGYAPGLVRTGFHPVDGAAHLATMGVSARLCALVANHSCACLEARRRGVTLDWPDEGTPLRDALWWADMTTTPTGEPTTFAERMAEVASRYGETDIVTLSLREANEALLDSVNRTEDLLRAQVK
jgi:hypothetical protein